MARVQGNITKGIPNGYKDFDLDALMRTDKVDDRSQALQAVCLAVETTRRLEDKLIPYGSNEVFKIYKDLSTDHRTCAEVYNLFTDFAQVTPEDVILSCNRYSTFVSDAVLTTYEQDMIWTRRTIENSIVSSSLQQEVRLELEIYDDHDRTGPLTLKILMDKMLSHSIGTRSALKQAWLYHHTITDYDGGNVTKFTSDWRNMSTFLASLGEDISDSRRQYLNALKECPNSAFRQHFTTLESVNDPKITDVRTLMREAQAVYRRLITEGKWSVRSKKEHAAFRQKKKAESTAAATKANKAAAATPAPTVAPQANQTKKTHDGQGLPIDRKPPAQGESFECTNPLTKKQEYYCESEYCKRWGNHSTADHAAWYEKLKKKREEFAAKRKEKASNASSSNTTGSTNPLRVPGGTGDFSGQSTQG